MTTDSILILFCYGIGRHNYLPSKIGFFQISGSISLGSDFKIKYEPNGKMTGRLQIGNVAEYKENNWFH
jgi:hypothetical protein